MATRTSRPPVKRKRLSRLVAPAVTSPTSSLPPPPAVAFARRQTPMRLLSIHKPKAAITLTRSTAEMAASASAASPLAPSLVSSASCSPLASASSPAAKDAGSGTSDRVPSLSTLFAGCPPWEEETWHSVFANSPPIRSPKPAALLPTFKLKVDAQSFHLPQCFGTDASGLALLCPTAIHLKGTTLR
eukprot:GHVT01092012.1.p1 GENE.GHVT01092012.1~~GHVT01092012.1.p1  ORF type:complete len:187 (+),score=35.57 GHVT01092012.1:663-1223(+)